MHSLTISQSLAGDLGHVPWPPSALGGLPPPTSRVMKGHNDVESAEKAAWHPEWTQDKERTSLFFPGLSRARSVLSPPPAAGRLGQGAAHAKSRNHLRAGWSGGGPRGGVVPPGPSIPFLLGSEI